MPTATLKSPQVAQKCPSTSRQAVQKRSGTLSAPTAPNVVRLRVIMALFRLSQRDVCRASGYSKAFVSQLLAGKEFGAGERFWMRLNASLHAAVRDSAANVFDVAPLALPTDDLTQIKGAL